MNGTISYLSGLAAGAVSIWFFFWTYRRKYDLDYKLDSTAHIVRWMVILAGFGLALLQGPGFKFVRIIAGCLLMAFLAWPNCAYYAAKLLRWSDPEKQKKS